MKKVVIGLLILLFAYLSYHYKSVRYGLQQAYGQYQVLNSSVDLEEYLQNENPPDSVLTKINLIKEVKVFAEKELGLKETDSYTSIYDQKGEAILWMLTASPEFELEAYHWKFPIAGEFEYKGFFDLNNAKKEVTQMNERGYDTDLDEVSAWSTLGFFSDPILSSMLQKDSGNLANLIIHELCHSSIYLKDSVELNENLASFIGRQGAEEYLLSIGDSLSVEKMRQKEGKRQAWREIIHKGSLKLDSLYKEFTDQMSIQDKREHKQSMINEIRRELSQTIYPDDSLKAEQQYADFQPNNAFFTGFLTYRARSNYFELELKNKFKGNLKEFIEYYIQEYGKK